MTMFPPMGTPPMDIPAEPAAAPAGPSTGPGPGAQSVLQEILTKLDDLEARLSALEGGGAAPPAPAGTPPTSMPPAPM